MIPLFLDPADGKIKCRSGLSSISFGSPVVLDSNFTPSAGTWDLTSATEVDLKDSTLKIKDNADATKVLQFQCSGITTATTRTLTVPDANDTLVGKATTDTLTNKTLTAPTITAPAITGAGTIATGTSFKWNAQTVAAAGSAQGDAGAITALRPAVVHVTGADATKGAVLPAAALGDVVMLKNADAANAILKVYPATGEAINALGANTAISMAAKTACVFFCVVAGQWYTLPLLPS